MAIFMFFYL